MATLVSLESGQPTAQLGGVIFTRAADERIHALADLEGRRLILPGTKYLGGYQTQAYELLKEDIHLPEDAKLMVVDGHDAVVNAILSGQGDAGFVRTGLIEQMAAEGRPDPSRLRIVNRQAYPGFPYLVSTRLYPEWAFVALPHLPSQKVRKLAAALMSLDASHPAARAAGIAGFAPPHDYLPVENIMRALHSPPFDKVEHITLSALWQQHRVPLVIGNVALVVIAVLLLILMRRNPGGHPKSPGDGHFKIPHLKSV